LAEAAIISDALVVTVPDANTVLYSPGAPYQVNTSNLTLATLSAASSVSVEDVGAPRRSRASPSKTAACWASVWWRPSSASR
jgi:hypothetical protein